jgi:uncharacterized membrane protein YeiB
MLKIGAKAVELGRMTEPAELAECYRKALKQYVGLLLLFTPVVFLVAFGMFKLFGTFVPGFVFAGIWASAWIGSAVWAVILRVRIRRSG